jgi:hypothetical protein
LREIEGVDDGERSFSTMNPQATCVYLLLWSDGNQFNLPLNWLPPEQGSSLLEEEIFFKQRVQKGKTLENENGGVWNSR